MLSTVDREFVKSWLSALRSGGYKQTKHRLQDHEGYCCLGVACVVLKQIIPIELDYSTYDDTGRYEDGKILRGENLDSQSAVEDFFKQLGLGTNGEPVISDVTDYNYDRDIIIAENELSHETKKYHELASLNDTFNLNFSEIADFIEVTYGSEWGL